MVIKEKTLSYAIIPNLSFLGRNWETSLHIPIKINGFLQKGQRPRHGEFLHHKRYRV